VRQFAPWCVWCQRLHPTWEAFAEEVEKDELPIKITKVW
jgi:thiol-disulfide isomerase/thioredoxin